MEIPRIGLGTHQFTSETAETFLEYAFNNGFRHLDCAFLYGNEHVIGDALNNLLLRNVVRRENLFITSKLPMNGMKVDRVSSFLTKSLSSLKLDYLDLYLIHAPFAVKYIVDRNFYPVNKDTDSLDVDQDVDYRQTWKELERLCRQGLVRNLGLSNFNESQILDVINISQIRPKVLQVEVHCYLQQKLLRKFCKQHGIIVEAFAPLGSPKIAISLGKKVLLNDSTIKLLALKYQKSPAQIVLRWLQQSDVIPIVSSESLAQIQENIQINDFYIDKNDLPVIDRLDCNERIYFFDFVPGVFHLTLMELLTFGKPWVPSNVQDDYS